MKLIDSVLTDSRRHLSLVPDGRGGFLLGYRPVASFIVEASDVDRLDALPAWIREHFASGCRLITGAFAYEAGLAPMGLALPSALDSPLAIVHAYGDVTHYEGVTALSAPWGMDTRFSAEMERTRYLVAIDRIQRYLGAGDCYQVNLSQRFSGHFRGDPLGGWQRLRACHPAPFSAYLEWDRGALLSASPERFLRIDGNRLVTEPIKGSQPRGRDAGEDQALGTKLLGSTKDRAENLMIVDLLRNDLGRICRTGSIRVEELFGLRRFSNVQHLVSRISGQKLDHISPVAALLACFPGGSITGAPKKRAMEIIQELEPTPRGFYCGSLFWQTSPEQLDSSILIRTLQTTASGRVTCHGGGGIVMDSDPEAEYEESLFKVRGLMEAVGAGR